MAITIVLDKNINFIVLTYKDKLNSLTSISLGRINENKFINYSGVENHDDYYTCDDDGLIHVQDQRGYYVILCIVTQY